MKIKSGLFFLLVLILIISNTGCSASKPPELVSFSLLYDIVTTLDATQKGEWEVANISKIDLVVTDENGNKITSLPNNLSGLPSNSNGMQSLDISSLSQGKYRVTLYANNQAMAYRDFVVISGTGGYWFSYIKTVNVSKETWQGFDELITVSHNKGLNDPNVIAISERVYFRNIRWSPDSNQWPVYDPNVNTECSSTEANKLYELNVKQLNITLILNRYVPSNAGPVYQFPPEWTPAGQYHTIAAWSPCNFGWNGTTRLYTSVTFLLELEALGK